MQIIFSENPRLVRRNCGGWLALSNRDSSLRIGVTGESEAKARDAYGQAIKAWKRNFADEPT